MVNLVRFPSVSNATEDGLLAMGGDLSVDTLVSAYSQGIFPWFNADQPVLWWSPDPRMVLPPAQVKVSRSLRKSIRNSGLSLSCNRAFDQVVTSCALRGADSQQSSIGDTWITQSMSDAYAELHRQAYAHSIEVWSDDHLVGGLYGVALGKVFFGESMFCRATDASKIALVALCRWLNHHGYGLIDCQVASDHLFSLGAREVPRDDFLLSLNGIDIEESSPNFAVGFEHFISDNDITQV